YVYRFPMCLLSNFFFSSRRRHTSFSRDWSSDVCSSDLDGPFELAIELLYDRVRELQQVTGHLPQRRQMHVDHVDAVVKVLSELLVLEPVLEVGIRGAYDARRHPQIIHSTEPPKRSTL